MKARTCWISLLALSLAGCTDLLAYRLRQETQTIYVAPPPPQAGKTAGEPPPGPKPLQQAQLPVVEPPPNPAQALPPPVPVQQTGAAALAPNPPTVGAQPTPRSLLQAAENRWASLDSYVVRLRRREVINDQPQPEELMLMKSRKEPFSVYFKWLGPTAAGREVLYVKGQHGDKIHTLTAAGDIPFVGAGMKMAMSPDSPMVKSRCRYSIREAGFGSMIQRFGVLVAAAERGTTPPESLRYRGRIQRPEFDEPVDTIEQVIPAKFDPLLPGGGKRFWHFDPRLGLPTLLIAYDDREREVEYYCYDRFSALALDASEFDPEQFQPSRSKARE